jgi:hypothetical protein
MGDNNPKIAAAACESYKRNPKAVMGDLLVFQRSQKFSYGGYQDYVDKNIKVKQIAADQWEITDRHYQDEEGGGKADYKNVTYKVNVSGEILTVTEGKYISRYSKCESSAPFAQADDTELLRQFCAQNDIHGMECSNAKNYQHGKVCNVKLQKTRFLGKYISSVTTALVIPYVSDCEPHATDFGGSVTFEKADGNYVFRGFQRGFVPLECVSVSMPTHQDRLICTTGHTGQGNTDSVVTEALFASGFSKEINVSSNILVTATDTVGAYGANKVECTDTLKLISLSKLEVSSVTGTVSVLATYADQRAISAACAPNAIAPKEAVMKAPRGEAFIAAGSEREGRFVIDLSTRSFVPLKR